MNRDGHEWPPVRNEYAPLPVQFNHASIIRRIGIAWQHVLSPKSGLGNRQISASARCHFRDLRKLLEQAAKLIAGFAEATMSEFFMGVFESQQRGSLIHCRRTTWRRHYSSWSLCPDGSQLLSLFDARHREFLNRC